MVFDNDELPQPLYKASLMAHVLKADLASGRLLQMDQDIPGLVTAAEMAAGTLRDLLGDLRRSPPGAGGLVSAMRDLVRRRQDLTSAFITLETDEGRPSPQHELVLH